MSKGSGNTRSTNSRSAHRGGRMASNSQKTGIEALRSQLKKSGIDDSVINYADAVSIEQGLASLAIGFKGSRLFGNKLEPRRGAAAGSFDRALKSANAVEISSTTTQSNGSQFVKNFDGIGGRSEKSTIITKRSEYVVGGKYLIRRDERYQTPKSDNPVNHIGFKSNRVISFYAFELKEKYRNK